MTQTTTTVGQVIVESIRDAGVTHAFCVPGESYLGVLDAFNDVPEVSLVATHHEEGAGFMAHAMALATGRPGVALVTRAPGLTHLSIALHAAQQDSLPLIAIVGQVPRPSLGREAFQEVDIAAFGQSIGKAGLRLYDTDRATEVIRRAFYLANAGRPGPVVVELPEDVSGPTEAARSRSTAAGTPSNGMPSHSVISQALEMLDGASSAALIVGGGVLRSGASGALAELVEQIGMAAFTGFRRFDAFPNEHAAYGGSIPWIPDSMKATVRTAEVVLAIGTRLGDFASLGYEVPSPDQLLIQVDVAAESMSVMRAPDLAIVADARTTITAMLDGLSHMSLDQHRRAARRAVATAANRQYLDSTNVPNREVHDRVDLGEAVCILRDTAPADTAIVSDAGAFSTFLNRYYRWSKPRTFFGTASGAMGYAVPAAIGAKLADPARPVVAVAGDGGFAMTMSEIHTAATLGLGGLVFLVFDNGTYGTIRQHQRRRYPGRHIAVDLGFADLAGVGEALGATVFRVTETDGLDSALRAALTDRRPSVIHCITDPEQLDAWAE